MSRQIYMRASKRFQQTKDYKNLLLTFSKRCLHFFFFFDIKQICDVPRENDDSKNSANSI